MSLRDQLVDLISRSDIEMDQELKEDTSLIRSGVFDSLALFNLASWIEENIDSKVDFTTIDVSQEWDTISDILHFMEKHRNHGMPGGGNPGS
jgi:acyl carrier protein